TISLRCAVRLLVHKTGRWKGWPPSYASERLRVPPVFHLPAIHPTQASSTSPTPPRRHRSHEGVPFGRRSLERGRIRHQSIPLLMTEDQTTTTEVVAIGWIPSSENPTLPNRPSRSASGHRGKPQRAGENPGPCGTIRPEPNTNAACHSFADHSVEETSE